MNFYDLTIIYLACGAPLGVYYFLQNRRAENSKSLWLKTFVNFLFWMPFAVRLLLENKSLKKIFASKSVSDSDIEKRLAQLSKELETTIINQIPQTAENIPNLSIFEVREILERYAGLTLAVQSERENAQFDSEFYKIATHKNPQLATICAARRNRQRLFFHQTEARWDFLKLIGAGADKNLYRQMLKFAILLEDFEAQTALEKMFAGNKQTEKPQSVNATENDLWKSETHKPLLINQTTSVGLKLSPATMNLRAKD